MTFRLSLILLLQYVALSCDVGYEFEPADSNAAATKLKATATWWTVDPPERADVYLSTAVSTACNSGYFGSQFHSDGKGNHYQTLIFSMWDNPNHVGKQNHSRWEYQSIPASGNCWRNALDSSGASSGVQCGQPWPRNPDASVNVSLHLGVPYDFTLAMIAQNKSGALWEVSMLDPVHNVSISVGKIFFVDQPFGLPLVCRSLGKSQKPPQKGLSSYSFLEYFSPPFDYTTRASWSNVAAFSASGDAYKVKNLAKDCCGHTYNPGDYFDFSKRCLPPECDSLEVSMECGPYLKPPLSVLEANPGCNTSSNSAISGASRRSVRSCWQKGPPDSLDQCFSSARSSLRHSSNELVTNFIAV